MVRGACRGQSILIRSPRHHTHHKVGDYRDGHHHSHNDKVTLTVVIINNKKEEKMKVEK